MKCPECGNECQNGFVQARDAGSFTQSLSMVTWYPEANKGKMIKKGAISLRLNAEGFYCDKCMKVYAVFEEK